MSYQDYLDEQRQKRKPRRPNLPAKVAKCLAALDTRPDGLIEVAVFVAMVRDSLPPKQQYHATRGAVVAALESMGLSMGLSQKRRCIVGYALNAPPTLVVDEGGRIREAA